MAFFVKAFSIYLILIVCSSAFAGQMANQVEPNMSSQEGGQVNMDSSSKHSLKNLSPEERKWYAKFQNGLMFFSGWEDISKDILACLPPNKKDRAKDLLETMGHRIGVEWAKDNDIRKIDTDQLRSWGDRLKKARKTGSNHVFKTVKAISAEVDNILQQDSSNTTS